MKNSYGGVAVGHPSKVSHRPSEIQKRATTHAVKTVEEDDR